MEFYVNKSKINYSYLTLILNLKKKVEPCWSDSWMLAAFSRYNARLTSETLLISKWLVWLSQYSCYMTITYNSCLNETKHNSGNLNLSLLRDLYRCRVISTIRCAVFNFIFQCFNIFFLQKDVKKNSIVVTSNDIPFCRHKR